MSWFSGGSGGCVYSCCLSVRHPLYWAITNGEMFNIYLVGGNSADLTKLTDQLVRPNHVHKYRNRGTGRGDRALSTVLILLTKLKRIRVKCFFVGAPEFVAEVLSLHVIIDVSL